MALKFKTLGGFQGSQAASKGKIKFNSLKSNTTNNGSALGYLGQRLAIGTAGIFEGFGDFVAGSVYQLAGDKEYAKYLHDNDVTGGWQKKLDASYNPSRGMQVAGDIASGVGQALPSVAIGVATGGTSFAAQAAGTVGLGMAYAGRGITSAVKKTGELGAKENVYGVLSGAAEGVTDMFLGGAQKAGKALWTVGKSAAKASGTKIARNGLLKGIWSSASSEFAEEFLQEYLDTGLLRMTGVDSEASTSFGDALYSGLIGGITGGILGGATGSVNAMNNIRRGESIRSRGLEGNLLATANYIRNDYLGKGANFDNVDSPALRTLSAAVDAYAKLDEKGDVNGVRGAMLLGEIQAGTFAFETEVGIRSRMAQIMANPTEELAQYASMAQGQAVTVEDLRQNRDGVAEMLAVRSFTAELMTESNTEKRVNMIREKVASERYGNIKESASFADEVGTDGAAVYRMDDGRYVIVTADGAEGNEGKYRVGFSETADFDEDHVMMHDGLEGEAVTKTLAGLADGSLTYNNGSQRVEPAQAAKNAPASGESVVGGQVSAEGANVAKRTENAGETRRAIDVDRKPILEIQENAELTERIQNSEKSKYDVIRDYLFEKLGGREFTMSDGRTVIMDRRDAMEMAHGANKARTAQLGNIEKLIENAVYVNSALNVEHNKFTDFHYYAVSVKYLGDIIDLWLNVGVGKNDKKNHLYAITNRNPNTKKGRGTIHYDVSRPVGNAIQNASSNTSIPQNAEKSTASDKKVSAEENGSKRSAVPKTREAKKRKLKRAQEHQKQQKAKKKAERLAAEMASNLQAEREVTAERNGTDTKQVFSRGYSDAEANEARKLVKNFDLLQPAARRAIIELYRSGKVSGASQTFMRHAANLIAYWRTGLWIIADDKIRDDGFFYVFDDGTRLITVKPAAEGRSITEAFMHEVGHDVWERADKETRHELYGMAVSGVDKTKLREIRKRYQTELSERGETVTNELLYEEIFANLLGEYIGTEDFLSRFGGGDVSALTRIKKTLSVMKKRFTGKDKYLYRKADDLFRAFTKVMAGQSLTATKGNTNSMRRAIVALEDGRVYVKASRNVISGTDREAWKGQISNFFDALLSEGDELPIQTLEGDTLTITWDETAYKARDEQMQVGGTRRFMSDKEFKVKLDAEAHIDEIAEVATDNPKEAKSDAKSHGFAKDGFGYRTAYFQDFDGTYYKLKISIGKNGDTATVYNVGQIKKDTLPASKVTAIISSRQIAITKDVAGSQPLQSASSGNSIAQNSEKSTTSEKKGSENNGSKRSALPKTVKTLANVALNETDKKRVEQYNRALTEYRGQEAELKSINNELKVLRSEKKNGTLTLEKKGRMRALAARKEELKGKMRVAEHSLLKMEALKPIQSIVKRERSKAKKQGKAEAKKDIDKRIESKATEKVNAVSGDTAKLNQHIQYLKNAVSPRKYTDGGNDAARVLENSALKGFIQFFSNRTAAYGIANKATREAVRGLLPWYTAENEVLTGNVLDEMLAKGDKNVNKIFGNYDPEVRARMEEIAGGEGNLTASELDGLGMIVSAIAKLYESYGRVFVDEKWRDAEAMAQEQYEELIAARGALVSDTDENGKFKGALKRLRLWMTQAYLYSAVTPEAVLRDIEGNTKGAVLSSLYRDVRLGEAEAKRVQATILQPVAEFFAKKENRNYRSTISRERRIEFRGVNLTAAQAVGLWETSRRRHAQDRMFDTENGGVRLAVYDEETGKTVKKKFKVTDTDLDNLYRQFTEQDREYIKALEKSFKLSTKYKTETDNKVLGYTNAISGHYYPITTDETYFARDVTDMREALGYAPVVYNKSFNKNTVEGAQAWLFIEDSLTVLNRHAAGIGAYTGLYAPLQNFGRVYGIKFDPTGQAKKPRSKDPIFFESVVGKTSLRGYINDTLWSKNGSRGTNLDDYLTKLFSDIQGIKETQSGLDRLVAKLQGAAVTASFGLNLKVIATQLASYPAAYKNLDGDVLQRGVFMKPDMEAMDEYSRITFARSFDGIGAAEGGLEKISEVGRFATRGIDFMDRQVIGRLWNACQLQVEKDGGGAFGSRENLRAAGNLLDNLLLDTQTTSLKADASALGRDKNVIAKMLTMFKTESMKSFSNLYGSFSAYVDHRRYAEAGMEGYSEMLDGDKKAIGKTVTSFLLSNAWVAAVAVAFSRIRKAAQGEEEEEKLAVQLAKEMGGNVADLFPVVSEVTSYFMDGYDMEYMPIATINDALSTLAGVSVLADSEATTAERAKYIRQSIFTLGELLGAPTRNLGRIALTATSMVNSSSAYLLRDTYDTAPTYASDLDRALAEGNERLASAVLSAWFRRLKGGKASSAVSDEILRLYAMTDGEGKSIFSMPKNVPSSLSGKQSAAFSLVYSEADGEVAALISSKAYKVLNDTAKAKAVKACYDIAWSRAAVSVGLESTGSAARMATAEGVDSSIMAAVAGFAVAHEGEDRKAHIVEYLTSLGLSREERNKYLAALGYKAS